MGFPHPRPICEPANILAFLIDNSSPADRAHGPGLHDTRGSYNWGLGFRFVPAHVCLLE
jgi:hypothetical protein